MIRCIHHLDASSCVQCRPAEMAVRDRQKRNAELVVISRGRLVHKLVAAQAGAMLLLSGSLRAGTWPTYLEMPAFLYLTFAGALWLRRWVLRHGKPFEEPVQQVLVYTEIPYSDPHTG